MTKFHAKAVFFARDAALSLAFYTRELGFSLDWTHEEEGKPHVFQVSLHGFELIVNQTEPATVERPGHGRVFIGLDEHGSTLLKQYIESRGVKFSSVHWGAPTVAICDPDQNEVFFWLAETVRGDLVEGSAGGA